MPIKNEQIGELLDAGQGGTLSQVGGKLIDALEIISEMNVAMARAHMLLAPLADVDWHGKWRVQKALDAVSIYSREHADEVLRAELEKAEAVGADKKD